VKFFANILYHTILLKKLEFWYWQSPI